MEHIKQALYKYSLFKEKQQTNYLKNQQNLKNVKTGEVLTLKYSFDSKQKEYVKTIEQKVNALVSLAVAQNLKPIFITLTVPSEFHPNKTLKNGIIVINKKYKLLPIITPGYSDNRFFRQRGIATIGFFPLDIKNNISGIHGNNEYISFKSLILSYNILLQTLKTLLY